MPPLQPESLPDSIRERLLVYRDLLLKWQKTINLVAPSTLADAWGRHFVDSLALAELVPFGAVVADIGSGAGFPGLVLAVARSDCRMHLIESDSKKCVFLSTVSRETGAQNVDVHVERIEAALPGIKAGAVTARALAPLPKLLELTRSQWQRANPANLLFMKGAGWRDEVATAQAAFDFKLDVRAGASGEGVVLCISKVADRRIA